MTATGITGGIPALYATSYTNATGGLSVVVTNKSARAHQVTIRVNGSAATGAFPLQFISRMDPSASNARSTPNAVAIQTANSVNPVTVPAYCVVRVDLKTLTIATIVRSANFQPGPVASQQLVTAFGSGFASQAIVAASEPFPTMLGDTTIAITDSASATRLSPPYYIEPGQASFLITAGVAQGAASLKVRSSGSTVLTG